MISYCFIIISERLSSSSIGAWTVTVGKIITLFCIEETVFVLSKVASEFTFTPDWISDISWDFLILDSSYVLGT